MQYPQSLAVYDDYESAQRTVDFLSDNKFPVEQCMIVGTDLKRIERITGRLTTSRVALGGVLSGLWMGVFVGLIFALFDRNNVVVVVLSTMLFGALFGVIWALVGYAATRGHRDFSSVTSVVATRYEVLVEHKVAQQARELLAQLPGASPTRSPEDRGSRFASQLALEDLAGGGHRQVGHELDEARVLVVGHLLLAPADQLVLGDRGTVVADDERLDLLAVALVGYADHRGQRDVRVRHQHLLDLARVHVVAAADDHVLGPVDDVVPAVLVPAGEVAGAEPAVVDGLVGGLGPVVVALHDVVALDRDLADRVRTVLDLVPGGLDQLHLHPGDRDADRADPRLLPDGEKLATGEVSERP